MLEQIHNLRELWLDNNSLQSIPGVRGRSERRRSRVLRPPISPFNPSSPTPTPPPPRRSARQSIGKLRQLRYLDLAKNRIETLDADVSGCEALEDLLLSSNMLQQLPDTIGTTPCTHTCAVSITRLRLRSTWLLFCFWFNCAFRAHIQHSPRASLPG